MPAHLHGSCAGQEGPLQVVRQLELLLNQLVPAQHAQVKVKPTHLQHPAATSIAANLFIQAGAPTDKQLHWVTPKTHEKTFDDSPCCSGFAEYGLLCSPYGVVAHSM